MWFAPEIAGTFLEVLEGIFQRAGHFEGVPYSRFEAFLASAAKWVEQEPNALRRRCFECHTRINELADREARIRKCRLSQECGFAYLRTQNIVVGLDDAYWLTRKDLDVVRRGLIDAGSLPPHAELVAAGGNLVLHWRTAFPRYAVAFEVTGRAGRDTSLELLMTVLNEAGDVLASGPIRRAFLDFDGYVSSFVALRERCATDAFYASAILAHLAEAWGTNAGLMVRQS